MIYAVETTDKTQWCQINARNCKYFTSLRKAKLFVELKFALEHSSGIVAFDKALDRTIKVYNAKNGNNETADALYFITTCPIN